MLNSKIEVLKETEETSQIDGTKSIIYLIKFPDGKEIRSRISEKMKKELENFGIIPSNKSPEEKDEALKGYLINAAIKYIELKNNKNIEKIKNPEDYLEDFIE